VGDRVKRKARTVADLVVEARRGRHRLLTRRAVLEEALALVDEAGVEGCTMRALAGRLGVTPRALYRHVEDKEDLLRGVAGVVVGAMRLPARSAGWRQRVRAVGVELRRVLAAHPRAVPVFAERATAGPAVVIAITDDFVDAFAEAGIDGETAVRVMFAVFNYTVGNVLVATQEPPAGAAIGVAPPDPFAGLDASAVPHALAVAPFLRRFTTEGLFASDEQFEFGLDLLLASLVEDRL
jgi:AcrR family transcriptional regulator